MKARNENQSGLIGINRPVYAIHWLQMDGMGGHIFMVDYGLALAGGGVRGAAHVGVLMALEEEGILPKRIAGASAGSIVAGLYASGMEVKELRDEVLWLGKHGKWYLDPNVAGILMLIPQILTGRPVGLAGILKGNHLMEYLCDLTGRVRIEDAARGILIPAVDLISGDTVVYTNLFRERNLGVRALRQEHVRWEGRGTLGEIMMASSSVPTVFSPRQIGKYRLVDGGVTNNLPVDLLIATGEDCVIAVDIGTEYEAPDDNSMIEVATHSFSIMSRELKNCRSSGERLLLKPRLKAGAGLLSFSCMEDCMEQGYHDTKEKMEKIKQVLSNKIRTKS